MRRHRGEATSTATGGDSGSEHPLFDLNYPPVEDRSGDGQESSSAHRASNHPLLDLLV
jgi:hypothetical protein